MTLELNDQQVSYLMQILAQRPWGEANEMIVAIQRQAAAGSPRQQPRLQGVNGDASVRVRDPE